MGVKNRPTGLAGIDVLIFLIDLALKIGRMNPLMPKVKG